MSLKVVGRRRYFKLTHYRSHSVFALRHVKEYDGRQFLEIQRFDTTSHKLAHSAAYCSAPTVMMPLGFEPTLAEPAAARCYCMTPLITTESGLVPAANGEPAPVISVIAPVFGLML